jgi:uncharacterized iron-regulated membrane protein
MRARSVVVYSVLRLLAFVVPFGLLMIFPVFRVNGWMIGVAALFAALIGLSLSILFLSKPREAVAEGIAERQAHRVKPTAAEQDADIEDAANDAVRGDSGDE